MVTLEVSACVCEGWALMSPVFFVQQPGSHSRISVTGSITGSPTETEPLHVNLEGNVSFR